MCDAMYSPFQKLRGEDESELFYLTMKQLKEQYHCTARSRRNGISRIVAARLNGILPVEVEARLNFDHSQTEFAQYLKDTERKILAMNDEQLENLDKLTRPGAYHYAATLQFLQDNFPKTTVN